MQLCMEVYQKTKTKVVSYENPIFQCTYSTCTKPIYHVCIRGSTIPGKFFSVQDNFEKQNCLQKILIITFQYFKHMAKLTTRSPVQITQRTVSAQNRVNQLKYECVLTAINLQRRTKKEKGLKNREKQGYRIIGINILTQY